MKKQIITGATILFVAGSLIITGCSKDDTTPPVITLNGSANEQSILNAAWTDQGATATDDEDGEVAVTVTGSVNKDLTGAYVITYTAVDAAGNEATAVRNVTVVNEASFLDGTYNVSDNCGSAGTFNYTQIVSASSTLNKRIHFNKFADYSNNGNIYADITATTITLPSQTGAGIGTLNENHTFQGTGTITGNNFTLTYTDQNNSQGGATANCTATFTKQ